MFNEIAPHVVSCAEFMALNLGKERLEWLFARRLFTKEGFTRALEDMVNINQHGGDFHTKTIFGDEMKIIYTHPPELKLNRLAYQSIIITPIPAWGKSRELNLIPDLIIVYSDLPMLLSTQPKRIRICATKLDAVQDLQDIVAHLEQYASQMEQVNSVIGFGLGSLKYDPGRDTDLESHFARNFLQHIAALVIWETLKKEQNNNDIRLCVQDPGYCISCRAYLSEEYNFFLFSDPTGFTYIDGNTFIVTKSPSIPVRIIATDVAEPYGGPARMLCDVIADDGMNEGDIADPSSPRCWDYKQKSISVELDDTEAMFTYHVLRRHATVFGKIGLYLKKKELYF
ncbi:hypothetical protein K505DRAFT_336897 [Melanomma pulvis-pyrius CBS 109.77]|uniref:SRR1-like domain-containing protein n=1 Tax=Melanomma pulvis-pyrius CBS 109.77 TaxID=1314802 RepID=A0A6A6XDZ5_9PLEO|nr:hypothetical protein K505DRAFT_336897 [Melanomma pulvis-pyrius CBS 109.77]